MIKDGVYRITDPMFEMLESVSVVTLSDNKVDSIAVCERVIYRMSWIGGGRLTVRFF